MSMYHYIIWQLNKSHLYRKIVANYKHNNIKKYPLKEINRAYHLVFGKFPNIEHPSNLIEKIYWMELYADLSLWTLCADKYRVREYIKDYGYESYLPKLLGKWDSPSEFTMNNLPEKFIIKTNNGCGNCIPVINKAIVDENHVRKQLKEWLEIPYGYSNSQLHYLNIPRCIIAEELLENDNQGKLISPNSLIDYKVWCINGKAESILVVYDRRPGIYCLDLYDINWKRIQNNLHFNGHFEYRESPIPQPNCLSEMISIAEQLANPFPQVRVDFYVLNNRLFLGELTFATGYGYFTEEYYEYLGKKIDITKIKKAAIPNYLSI